MQRGHFFVGGGREDLAMADGKLDSVIKLLAGCMDQLDNDKQSRQPKETPVTNLAGHTYMLMSTQIKLLLLCLVFIPAPKSYEVCVCVLHAEKNMSLILFLKVLCVFVFGK